MNCPMESHNPEMLVAYAAGQLNQEALAAFEKHLSGCPACSATAADQMAVWQALDVWEAPSVPSDFDRRLYGRIDAEQRLTWWERLARPFHPLMLRRILPLTATAALLLMAGLILERPAAVAPATKGAESVRAEQVERTLDDLELLGQFSAARPGTQEYRDAM
ncbi:MAG TPA: zf-HC2 domain-containing protein [Bryobacteraceae bacterium]|nr:zf-HC2 domain-containing protein [Bryobacteraceae bacterium]